MYIVKKLSCLKALCPTCEGESNENLKNFFTACILQIGSVQLVIFQHSPCCVQCMSYSASLMPGFLLKKIPLATCIATHALALALLHRSVMSFHQSPPWVAQVGRGEVRWVWRMRKALKTHVLDAYSCHMGSMGQSVVMLQQDTSTELSTTFWSDCWFQMIPKEVTICGTGDCDPLGHVVLYKWASVIPEQHQHQFSRRCLRAEFFGFWWGGMVPLFAYPLHFMLEVVDPAFIASHYALQEAVTLCFVLSQKFLVCVHASFLQFKSQLSRNPPYRHCGTAARTSWVIWWAKPWLMSQYGGHIVHHNATVFLDDTFNLRNCLLDSVGLARSRSICHTTHTLLKLPTPFIHLLQW
jgi:hypothetical protein